MMYLLCIQISCISLVGRCLGKCHEGQHTADSAWQTTSDTLCLEPWEAESGLWGGCIIAPQSPECQSSTLYAPYLSAGEPKYENYFHRASAIPALGSSGAVNGIVMFDILLFPSSTVMLYGVVPMPAWGLGALFLSFDIYGALGVSPFCPKSQFQ